MKCGVSSLKKYRIYRTVFFAAALVFLCACSTTHLSKDSVAPFALMDAMQILFLLPVQEYRDAALAFSEKLFPDSSNTEREQIVSHVETVYGGYNAAKAQFVFTGSFPPIVIKSALVKKNGWTAITAQINNAAVPYYRNAEANIEIFSGVPNMLIVSDNLLPMLERLYSGNAASPQIPSWAAQTVVVPIESDVLFYVERFSAVIEKMLNIRLPRDGAFALASAEGQLSKTGADSDSGALLSLDIDFKDTRAVTPALLLLSFAGVFAGADITAGEGAHVLVKNVPIPAELITGFLL
jgi:hypothetical protein